MIRKFKAITINMLRALRDKVDGIQKQIRNVSRDGNPKKELKSNASD